MAKEQKHRITSDEMQKAACLYKETSYKYDAFISYRHVEPDQSVAKQVHQMIETFKAPGEFYQDGKRPTFRVFRDREELAAKDLGASIEEALATSRYLIVICSKRTPLSEWCIKEIEIFKSLHGDERIIPVLIEGEPDEAFPKQLRELKKPDNEDEYEILAADIRPDEVLKDGFEGYEVLQNNNRSKLKELTKRSLKILKTERYRIMATILGCTFGDLKQRDKERRSKKVLTVSLLAGVVFLIFAIFMTNAYQKAESARQEAVQSNAGLLMKNAKDIMKKGDYLKAVLVAREAMSLVNKDIENYEDLKADEDFILNSAVYHRAASTMTSIFTNNYYTKMSLSNDGKYIAYGMGNYDTAVASAESAEVLKVFSGHSQQVVFVDFSKDGKYLASASFDNSCIIYDMETGEEKVKFEMEGLPRMAEFSEDNSKFFYAVSNEKNYNTILRTYDTQTWQQQGEIVVEGELKKVDIKSDGSEVLVSSVYNNEAQLSRRNLIDGSVIDFVPGVKEYNSIMQKEIYNPYIYVRYSNDGKSIILMTQNEIMKISLEDKREIFRLKNDINLNYISNLIYECENGDKIAFRSSTRMYIADGNTGEIIDDIPMSKEAVLGIIYNEDTDTLIGFGSNGAYTVWKDKKITENHLGFGDGVPTEFLFSKDGSKVFANSRTNQVIKMIDLQTDVPSVDIDQRIIAASNDSSHILLLDSESLSVSDDNGKTSKNIAINENIEWIGGQSSFNNAISNDGRYYANVTSGYLTNESEGKEVLAIYDLHNDNYMQLNLPKGIYNLRFSDDSKYLLIYDSKEGLIIFDAQDLKPVKTYKNINTYAKDIKISKNANILVINNQRNVAEIYDLETNELKLNIPGEVVDIQNDGDEIILKGIQNEAAFSWSSKEGLSTWEIDRDYQQTEISISDYNYYNAATDTLMMIRNNTIDRKCYIIDFSTGKLKLVLDTPIEDYNVNGFISPDGKIMGIDRGKYEKTDNIKDNIETYMSTTLYPVLSEEEVSKKIEEMLAGRTLSPEEKKELGIKAE